MLGPRRARDVGLLDALDAFESQTLDHEAWRIARLGGDPVQGHKSGGRWDPPDGFDVLYTALDPKGAKAEIFFHLNRAPVFPSSLRFLLHRLRVRTEKTLSIADLETLKRFGVDTDRFSEVGYRDAVSRTQEIGDAAHFIGYDSLLVLSARHAGQNLVVFTDRVDLNKDLEVMESREVDWEAYRRENNPR